MSRLIHWLLIALIPALALTLVSTTFAMTPERETRATPRATPRAFRQLEADFSIYNWRKSETPRDLIGTMTVYARGGDGH